ncbi:trans-aconitate 2-methyltransferase [Salinihabitans flavidus]|uniref:Trans-aconitate 2-methyltransferase n=1 Tax=Salinihabitans flavidus TaxID=569882 RepID=A0A1H8R673_9RHOB|nr:methyltransferase domain-containing protein [Salinihabitans flavidus]SEO61880.1 trans-aconitate 2-methyltransferase [Salinihabitans flavidus]
MTGTRMADWNPGTYHRFRDLRLRPALDLLGAVGPLRDGDVVDLGCGSGTVAGALTARLAGHRLIGVDASPAMLAEARGTGMYTTLCEADIATWRADRPPALIFSNAALHWLDEHAALMPRLARMLAPGGTLAVQMPHQSRAPSHRGWHRAFVRTCPRQPVPDGPDILEADDYFDLLCPLGAVQVWETEYLQHLPAANGAHPVRRFTESTFARPFLEAAGAARETLIAAYEAQIAADYPLRADGSALLPFRRLFFLLTV